MTYYKHDIEYITKYFTPGSEAVKIAPKEQPKKTPATSPRYLKREQLKVYVDPVALGSVAVAAVLLVMMLASMVSFSASYERCEQMENTLAQISDQNALLRHAYRSSYEDAEVEMKALALGMIPSSEAERISVTVTIPQPEPEPSLWDDIVWFFKGLLA